MTGVACVVANIETRAWIRVLFGHGFPSHCLRIEILQYRMEHRERGRSSYANYGETKC